ncbi:MAG TPA: RluA family pseudouridine synthase [Rhodospirillales bacterium]|nr:RluA family pseudouridine synthase [Rhodospirillales bacterium]
MSGVVSIAVSDDEADLRLDRWFRRHYPQVSHIRLQKLLRSGQVRVDGKRVKANARISPDQMIRVPPLGDAPERKAPPSASTDTLLQDRILHIDDHVIVLDKPPGLAVQGGTGITRSVDGMLDTLRFDHPDRPRLVHRLDKDTSGILLLARSPGVAAKLAKSFRSRDTRKIYWAVVVGVPDLKAGRINMALAKLPGKKGERMVPDEAVGKKASTLFRVIERASRQAAWVHLEPLTGRTHQLRVHMAETGTPIHGDGKYGAAQAFIAGQGLSRKLHLHARALRIPHPGKSGSLEVFAPLPDHMRATWQFLGFEENADDDPFSENMDQ